MRKKIIRCVKDLGTKVLIISILNFNIGCFTHQRAFLSPSVPHQANSLNPLPHELNKITLPPYVVEPPDILLIDVYLPPANEASGPIPLYPQPISGQHLVRLDGTISLGVYGSLPVSGLNLDQISNRLREFIFEKIKHEPLIKKLGPAVVSPDRLLVAVDVIAYNSKTYYIIADGAGYGEQIYRFTATGNETVLDALSFIGGLPMMGSKRDIWIARRTPHVNQPEQIIPIDYVAMTQQGYAAMNYQILPGDRIYVRSQRLFRIDGFLQKVLTPMERILGFTLLGSSTVYSLRGVNSNNGGVP